MIHIGVILAGGRARRLGGGGKGALLLGRGRLVDHVIEKLEPQIDRMLIAGPDDYGTGICSVPDRSDGPAGPAAGLWAVAHWILQNEPQAEGFMTAPVDGPFLPADLYEKLSRQDACAVASDDSGDHPTFAYWVLPALVDALTPLKAGKGAALRAIAKQCNAKRVSFPPGASLMNINTPEDLARAKKYLQENL